MVGYTFVTSDQKVELLVLQSDWLDFVNHAVAATRAFAAGRNLYAHFDLSREEIGIFGTVAVGKIRRQANRIWFENQTSVELEDIDEGRETYFSGCEFLGWQRNDRIRTNLNDALSALFKSLMRDNELMLASMNAKAKLDDLMTNLDSE